MSPKDVSYNCIAWAAEDDARWWEPDSMNLYYWPEDTPRTYTLDAYISAYKKLGYDIADDLRLEPGFKKIVIYVRSDGRPQHVARQLVNGRWTSKLGESFDVEHDVVSKWSDGIIGLNYLRLSSYGIIGAILKKAI